MIYFQFEELLTDGSAELHTGISALEVHVSGSQVMLYSATGPTGGIQAFVLGSAGPTLVDQKFFTPGPGPAGPAQLEWISFGGLDLLVPLGRRETTALSFDMASDGTLTGTSAITVQGGFPGAIVALEGLNLGPLDMIYASHWGTGGITVYSADASGMLTQIGQTGGDSVQGIDLIGIEAIDLSGETYLITASGAQNQVTSYQIDAAGMPVEADSIGAADGLGIDVPSALVPVTLGGLQYLVVAAAGSSSLSVLRLDPNGGLVPVDHVIDGLETRFQNVSALEAVTVGDRVFLVAGGGDDGLSLFTLLPGGRLLYLAQIADSSETALMNVTALALWVEGGVMEIYAAGEGEAGITRLSVDLGTLGATSFGTIGDEMLTGTAAADLIDGGAGDDTLSGGAGADILIDGTGSDRLQGGAGADIFVFAADNASDRVVDFDSAADRLDISALGLIRSIGQLDIQPTATGAVITYADETIVLQSAGGGTLSETDLADVFVFALDHMPVANLTVSTPPPDEPGVVRQGGAGDDTLLGGAGDDTLSGGGGANDIDGGPGTDLLDFSDATGRVFADIQIDQRGAGFLAFYDVGQPQGDTYVNLEDIIGGAFADNLRGDSGSNYLRGGGVSDRLYGRGGDDILDGGTGADALYGNMGADTMTGGSGAGRRDRFIYFDIDESGVGAGNRDTITDFVAGEDRIEISRFDADTTQGGNQGFDFIGAAGFSGTAGELGYVQAGANTIVQADVNGDGLADFEIELSGLLMLSAGDFLL